MCERSSGSRATVTSVSVAVDLRALGERLDEYGPRAYLLTVTDGRRPHAVSVTVRLDGDRLITSVGRRTAANLVERPDATFLWSPVGPGGAPAPPPPEPPEPPVPLAGGGVSALSLEQAGKLTRAISAGRSGSEGMERKRGGKLRVIDRSGGAFGDELSGIMIYLGLP